MSAVSNSVMPASSAAWTTACVAASSIRPPKLLQPSPTTETRNVPMVRVCMRELPVVVVGSAAILAQLHADEIHQTSERPLHDRGVLVAQDHVALAFVRAGRRLTRFRQSRLHDQRPDL